MSTGKFNNTYHTKSKTLLLLLYSFTGMQSESALDLKKEGYCT